ncbi:hypothetical protein [Actinomadura sp. DC4]|uniref:hypothetical protein n=1 Tax=Actinomadura sp. DC4 TaxID=3055069 RepID=UPI0025B06BD6|nr:hypothetical protein [Actinomadura sp. DC4]MDN3353493.1 hypothetical protein [Actinomadura sp. DC4]
MTTAIGSRPLLAVVLSPSPDSIAREEGRGKAAYGRFTIGLLDGVLRRETTRLGLWLDTSAQAPAETAEEILTRAWTKGATP